jgi:hypothetical protein
MHNQTNQDWLEGVGPTDSGIGLFLIPDVNVDQFGAVQKIITDYQAAEEGV